MTDAETTAATQALAHRLRERDEAMRDGAEYADADIFAAEFILALRTKGGWRPTAAKVVPVPRPAEAGSGDGPPEDYRAIRAEWEAREHPHRSREDGAA